MQPKCYSYIRFSSLEQGKGDSLRRQTKYAETYAKDNGFTLDDSLSLRDLGLSAFTGQHRTKGALGKFLDLVDQGSIPAGSHLVIEELDRLTRQEILEAVHLFTGILLKNIILVTAADNMVYQRDQFEIGELVISAVKLAQGHDESLKKSKRLKSAWSEKRAKLGDKKLTARAPAWLRLSDDKTEFSAIQERAEIIQQIFEMKIKGIGSESIAKLLNQVNAWSPKNGWRKSYIDKILRTRAVIGEFQPHQFINTPDGKRGRQPVGDPIPGYFPRVVPDDLFHAVQANFVRNRGFGGKNGKISNLFGHIVKCGYCGEPLAFLNKGPGPKGGKLLLCDKVRRGMGCHRHTVHYSDFEKLILKYCKGLSVGDLLPDANQVKTDIQDVQLRLSSIQGELADIESRITNLMDSIATTGDKRIRDRLENNMSELLDRAEEIKRQEKIDQEKLRDLSSTSENTQQRLDSLNELFVIMDEQSQENVSIIRMRLRDKLRAIISRIDVYPVGRFRMTTERVEKLTQVVLGVHPELAGKVELKRLQADLIDQINNKDYGLCHIYFHGGSIRTVTMGKKKMLAIDFDREAGQMINRWIEGGVEKSKIYPENRF